MQYYYQGTAGSTSPLTTVLLNTLGQLLTAGSQVGSLVKGNASAVTSQLSAHPGFITAVNPTQGGSQTPQAYLTLLFFDERFEPIAESDGGVVRQQVASAVGSAGATLGLGNIRAPRNGYVLVYVSNSSEQYVYFDNLQVGKVNGNLLEENHYYSFGLRIQALSSRRFTDGFQGQTRNDLLYNGKELLSAEADPGWLEYGFRYYDPQIGRFHQADPIADELSSYSPYHYAYNDPIMLIDWMGLAGITPDFLQALGKAADAVGFALAPTLETVLVTAVRKAPAASQVARTASWAKTALNVGRVAADFTPIVGSVLDISEGIRDRNYWMVAGGVAFGVLDFFTFGGGSLVKGGVKFLLREGSEWLARQSVKAGSRQSAEIAAKEAAKGGVQYTKSSLALGREMHAGYKVAEHAPALGRFKEFTGIKGIRPDFVDFGTKTIYELKPFNPRGIQLGTKQLNNYKSLFEQNYGGTWKTVLDHY